MCCVFVIVFGWCDFDWEIVYDKVVLLWMNFVFDEVFIVCVGEGCCCLILCIWEWDELVVVIGLF